MSSISRTCSQEMCAIDYITSFTFLTSVLITINIAYIVEHMYVNFLNILSAHSHDFRPRCVVVCYFNELLFLSGEFYLKFVFHKYIIYMYTIYFSDDYTQPSLYNILQF